MMHILPAPKTKTEMLKEVTARYRFVNALYYWVFVGDDNHSEEELEDLKKVTPELLKGFYHLKYGVRISATDPDEVKRVIYRESNSWYKLEVSTGRLFRGEIVD